MPDPFGTLPSPLPLLIFKDLEDLGSLHYLLQASPAANAIFTMHHAEITESILANLVPELQRVLRLVVKIRSRPVDIRAQCCSVDAFNTFRLRYMFPRDADQVNMRHADTTYKAVRSLASTAAHVQQLSSSILETYLARINNIKPWSTTKRWYGWMPPGLTRYEIIKCEQASWMEEQRVLRALWRLVVYFDLRRLLQPHDGQDSEVWRTLGDLGPWSFWELPKVDAATWQKVMQPSGAEEIDCILAFLSEESKTNVAGEHLRTQMDALPMATTKHFGPPIATPSLDREHIVARLTNPAPGRHSLRSVRKSLLLYHPNIKLDFPPFQALGFGFWDEERLFRLGLASSSEWDELSEVSREQLVMANAKMPSHKEKKSRWWSLTNMEGELGISHEASDE